MVYTIKTDNLFMMDNGKTDCVMVSVNITKIVN